jgi:hypothetical protein
MKLANIDSAWEVLVQRKAERKESRTAFLAALLMDRCKAEGGRSMTPIMAEAFAVELVRLAEGIKRLCEADCNQGLTPAQETRQNRLESRFAAIANRLGFNAKSGGDPRGACAYLIDPDEPRGDGWGDGFAVYR